MEFIEEIVAGMTWIGEVRQFSAQRFDLLVVEHPNAGEITVLVKEFDLIVGEAILVPIFSSRGRFE